MLDEKRVSAVRAILIEHRLLQHVRESFALTSLAVDIVKAVDRCNPVWRKWDGPREAVARSAALCWLPVADLRDFLNDMDGPPLTSTDVAQRLRSINDEDYAPYPNSEVQPGCLALYEAEKAQGTELPAIIGALQEFVDTEEERLRVEQAAAWRKQAEDARIALEQRFLSGADCKWTAINRSAELYCRINGRAFRLSPTKDKMWNLHRVNDADDDEGELIGKYQYRRDANRVVSKVAYHQLAGSRSG